MWSREVAEGLDGSFLIPPKLMNLLTSSLTHDPLFMGLNIFSLKIRDNYENGKCDTISVDNA